MWHTAQIVDALDTRVNSERLDEAVALASSGEPPLPREMRRWLHHTLSSEPWPYVMGDVIDRGGPNGLVIVDGREVCRWGDAERREMTFSIAKSALASVAGVAFDDGLLPDLDEAVVARVPLVAFGGAIPGGVPDDATLARDITWRQLLTQTSDWRGTLFDIPWWADPQGEQSRDDPPTIPGARFAYNDVRVNLCCLALTHLLGTSLEVALRRVLSPIGVPHGWEWRGLHQMHTVLADGSRLPVVTASGHWGAGLWLSTCDLARFGLLHLRRGAWRGTRVLSERWCRMMLAPTAAAPAYGLMWWRNPAAGDASADPPHGVLAGAGEQYPGSGVLGFAAHGTGEQIVWCDPDRDLVAVVRWCADPIPVIAAITAAITVAGTTDRHDRQTETGEPWTPS